MTSPLGGVNVTLRPDLLNHDRAFSQGDEAIVVELDGGNSLCQAREGWDLIGEGIFGGVDDPQFVLHVS